MSPNFLPDVFPTCFLNWRTGRAVERRYGGLMSASVSTAQWSEIPGTLRDDFINPGLLVIQRSRMFLSLVGSFCTWVKAWSSRSNLQNTQQIAPNFQGWKKIQKGKNYPRNFLLKMFNSDRANWKKRLLPGSGETDCNARPRQCSSKSNWLAYHFDFRSCFSKRRAYALLWCVIFNGV